MGGGGGDTSNNEYYQQQQLQLQRESIELQKASAERAKYSVTEPIKSVENTMEGASSEAARAAQLRRGIASTFNRPTAFQAGGSATGGTAAKLGE